MRSLPAPDRRFRAYLFTYSLVTLKAPIARLWRNVHVAASWLTMARGDVLLSHTATRALITRFLTLHDPRPGTVAAAYGLPDELTDREREIVALAATGMSDAEIAEYLVLSPLIVKMHANHAMARLGARDRAQLVVFAYPSRPCQAVTGTPLPTRADFPVGLLTFRSRPGLT
jgi:DNA-binding CsgD family transcriptional regulator